MTSAERSSLVALREKFAEMQVTSEREFRRAMDGVDAAQRYGEACTLNVVLAELDAILSIASRELEVQEQKDIDTRVDGPPYSEGSGLPQRPTR